MSRDYTPKHAKSGAAQPVVLRCKACAGRFEALHPESTVTCPECKESWRIRWFTPDSAMVTAPADWAAYQARSRRLIPEKSGHE